MRRSRSGQMLVVTLWMMGLVSLAVGALTMWAGHEARLSRIPLEALQREAVVQAAVHHAIALIRRDDAAVDHLGESWATGEEAGTQVFADIPVGPGMFRIGVSRPDGGFTPGLIDEGRKLHLNTAGAEALRLLITSVNVSGVAPGEVADAILDWRTATVPEEGVCAGEPPPCHNGLFDSVDELRLVPGMTSVLFDALAPYVTVYGGPAPNVNTADPLVLRAWGIPDAQVGEIVTQRQTQPFNNPYLGLSAQSTAFAVSVEAWVSASSVRTRVRAVIDRDGRILAWLPQ